MYLTKTPLAVSVENGFWGETGIELRLGEGPLWASAKSVAEGLKNGWGGIILRKKIN